MSARAGGEYLRTVMPDMKVAGPIRGIGLPVLSPSGELWVQRDLRKRQRTGRREGDLSIIFETEKPGESHRSNVLGAVSELVDDATLPQIASRLYTLDGLHSTPRMTFGSNGSAISYVTAVTVLDNPHFNPIPHDAEETEPVGWMSPAVLLSHDNVRPLAQHAVSYLADNGIIDRTLAAFRDPQHKRELVIPSGHVIAEFHRQREEIQDMVPGRAYSVVS
jgi:hypothetical protein